MREHCLCHSCSPVPSRPLTPREAKSLEKIALLRGHIGKLRAQIFMAKEVLAHGNAEGFVDIPVIDDVHRILCLALELQPPEAP